jgi:hypothetical protein
MVATQPVFPGEPQCEPEEELMLDQCVVEETKSVDLVR